MGFYVDIAEALDAEGIESRVNDGTLFVPVSEDLEIQFVDITGGTGIPGANVFLAVADVAEEDEEFEAALVGVVFTVEDAVDTVARHVATDLVVGTVRDLIDGDDPRIVDLEFVQDPVDALTVSAEVGESSELVVTFEDEGDAPSARVRFITVGEDFEELVDQAVAEVWDDGEEPDPDRPVTTAAEADRRRILEGIVRNVADMTEEVLELGSYSDFDRLFDVLFVAGEQAAAWEELLVPLDDFWDDGESADDGGSEGDTEDAAEFDDGNVDSIG